MARLKTDVKRRKQAQAKRLYLKQMTLEEISEIISISLNSLRNWKIEGYWDDALRLQNITPSEMQMKVLDTMQEMERGEKPKFTPDEISKLAKAYDVLSDKKKNFGYMMDNFNTLSDFLLKCVTQQTTQLKKQELLEFTQKAREYMDEVLNDQRRKVHD